MNGLPPPMPISPPSHLVLSLGDAEMASGGPTVAPSDDVSSQREWNQQLQDYDDGGGIHSLPEENAVPQREHGPVGPILLRRGILIFDFGPGGSVAVSSLQGGHHSCVDGGQLRISSLLSRQLIKRERVDLELRHRAPRVRGVVFPVVRRAVHVILAENAPPIGSAERASAL